MSYDGKYIIVARTRSNSYTYEIWKHDESTSTYTKLAQTVQSNWYTSMLHINLHSFLEVVLTTLPLRVRIIIVISDIKLYKHTAGTDTWTATNYN